MRKPLAKVTDEDIRGATCIVLCNVGHTKSLAVAGKSASPTLLAAGSSAIKPQTLFVVVCSELEVEAAMARLKPLRHDIKELDIKELHGTAGRAFAAGP